MVQDAARAAMESRAQQQDQFMSLTQTSFHELGIRPDILGILDRLKFTIPTPIQHAAIPSGLAGRDVIGVAQTGTGKTLAFGVPIVQSLRSGGRALIIVPTRELALQVEENLRKLGRPLGLGAVALIGGAPIHRQQIALRSRPALIVATPGRLIDHLQSGSIDLRDVKILVLDEADRMLDMGFAPQIAKILRAVPTERQTMLFSATMPAEIVEIAGAYMQNPERVEVATSGTAAEEVTQELFVVKKEEKPALLEKVLFEYTGSVLVFSRTKHGAKKILRDVHAMGHSGAEIHANRSLNQRREALDGFKSGRYRVLVATDIAARGIDVEGIQLVLNYDIPEQAGDYVHRIGRTGRAGRTGHAISFATPDQGAEIRDIERLIRSSLPVSPESPQILEASVNGRNMNGGRRSGGSDRRPDNNGRRSPRRPADDFYSGGGRGSGGPREDRAAGPGRSPRPPKSSTAQQSRVPAAAGFGGGARSARASDLRTANGPGRGRYAPGGGGGTRNSVSP